VTCRSQKVDADTVKAKELTLIRELFSGR